MASILRHERRAVLGLFVPNRVRKGASAPGARSALLTSYLAGKAARCRRGRLRGSTRTSTRIGRDRSRMLPLLDWDVSPSLGGLRSHGYPAGQARLEPIPRVGLPYHAQPANSPAIGQEAGVATDRLGSPGICDPRRLHDWAERHSVNPAGTPSSSDARQDDLADL